MKRFVVKTVGVLFSSLIVLSLLASLNTFAPSAVAQAQATEHHWPMFGQNPQHTGYTDSPAPTSPAPLWNFTTGDEILFPPSVAYGKVFVGSMDNKTYALNQSTGEKIWEFKADGTAIGSPAVADGKVFIGSWDGQVYALNQTTGDLIWNYAAEPPAPSPIGSPIWGLAVADGTVFAAVVTPSKGSVFALDQSTGAKKWNLTTDRPLVGPPAVANGRVFIVDIESSLLALNEYTGAKLWNYTLIPDAFMEGVWFFSPALANDKVFIGSPASELIENQTYAFDQSTGVKVWNFTTDGVCFGCPAVAYGKVFVVSWRAYRNPSPPPYYTSYFKVYALDLVDGHMLWEVEFNVNEMVTLFASVAEEMVFLSSYNDTHTNIYALNQSDGSKIWEYSTARATPVSAPVVADGKLFVAINRTIYAFGTHSLALTDIAVSSSFTVGEPVSVNLTVVNEGDFTENFNLTLYYNNTKIETRLISGLVQGTSRLVSFLWNTTDLQPGNYTLKAVLEGVSKDKLTIDNELLRNIAANAPPPGGVPWEIIIPIIVAAAVVAAIVIFLKKRPKKAKPPRIKMSAEPFEILADGKSTSNITVELIDEKGTPYPATADTQVSLSATDGRIAGSVTIPKGQSSASTALTSSMNIGTMGITATSKGLKQARIGVFFKEKKRYCMHCGQIMAYAARTCAKCGKAPPAGVDTKVCRNCKSVIPAVAEFCSECGAGQPE